MGSVSYETQSLLGQFIVPMHLHVLCISYKYMTAQSILPALSKLNHVWGSRFLSELSVTRPGDLYYSAEGQRSTEMGTRWYKYVSVHRYLQCICKVYRFMDYTHTFWVYPYRDMESTWIATNTNTRWLLGGLWEIFMHRLGSRCSCGVCLGSGADFWLSATAELSVTLWVTERLTSHSDSFPFHTVTFPFSYSFLQYMLPNHLSLLTARGCFYCGFKLNKSTHI